jgi:hypothetical protein
LIDRVCDENSKMILVLNMLNFMYEKEIQR